MTAPENVIIKEPGPFMDQPYWVEDYYQNVVKEAGATRKALAYGPITDTMRHNHKFPPHAEGVVLQFQNLHDPDNGPIAGFVLDQEEYERFSEFARNNFRLPDKNNYILIDDIVAAIVQNDLFTAGRVSLDRVYEIIREAVYSVRPNHGPDDVWVDTIVDALLTEGLVGPEHPQEELRTFFTQTFIDFVYGYHPAPAASPDFSDALEAELGRHGYIKGIPDSPPLRAIIEETAAKHPPRTPGAVEREASPMRNAAQTVKDVRDILNERGFITNAQYSDPNLSELLEQSLFRNRS